MSFEILPMDAALGAEVKGIDLSQPIGEEDFAQLRDAYHQHALLLFRDQDLTPEQHKTFTRGFGALEVHVLDQWRLPGHPEILVVSNLKDGDRHVGIYNAGKYWHTDLSYMQAPSKGSVLYAIEVPHDGDRPLGDTRFTSTAAAYDRLSDATKTKIENLKAAFSLAHQRAKLQAAGDNVALTPEQLAKTPIATHRIVQEHPVTGRRVLFVNEGHTIEILGLPDEEGEALLAELKAHATDPQFVYCHSWRVGDVLMWDNIQTQHLASFDYALPQRRYMHRTTLKGVEIN